MSGSKAQTIATLVACRAAIEALLLELTDPVYEEPPAPADGSSVDASICQHGERQEMGTFGATEHWICKLCGYEYRR